MVLIQYQSFDKVLIFKRLKFNKELSKKQEEEAAAWIIQQME